MYASEELLCITTRTLVSSAGYIYLIYYLPSSIKTCKREKRFWMLLNGILKFLLDSSINLLIQKEPMASRNTNKVQIQMQLRVRRFGLPLFIFLSGFT